MANRRSLDEELERRVESIRPGTTLCGLMIDLDDFKSINDRFGHEAGDRALEDVAKLLLASVRVDDMVARLGGDEFVVLADIKESAALEDLVERIERSVEHHNASVQRRYHLSLSIGRAIFDRRGGGPPQTPSPSSTRTCTAARGRKNSTETASGRRFGLEEPLLPRRGGSKDTVPRLYMGPVRLERTTCCLEGSCSIQLSYDPR